MTMQSESLASLAQALAHAQFAIEGAKKNAQNPHLKNKYADLGSVWDAVREPLSCNGLAVVQLPMPSEPGTLRLRTQLLHKSGEWLASELVMPVAKQDPQGYGSALTYARRYALAAMLGVTQEDDDGQAASGPRPTPAPMRQPSPSPLASKRQLDMLWATAKEVYGAEAEGELRKLIEGAGLNSSKELTTTQASDMIAALQAYKADAS